jgi:hypothetical protein
MPMITARIMTPTTIRAISPASRPLEAGVVVVVVVAVPVAVVVLVAVDVPVDVDVLVVVVEVVVAGGGPKFRTVPLAPTAYMLVSALPQMEASAWVEPLVMAVQEVPS